MCSQARAPSLADDVPAEGVDEGAVLIDGPELLQEDFATEEVEGLDLSGTLPHRRDADVAHDLLLLVRLDVPVAPVHLDAEARALCPHLREKSLENRRQEPHPVIDGLLLLAVALQPRLRHLILQNRALINHRAPSLRDGLLRQQHLAHGRVHNDGISCSLRVLNPGERAHAPSVLSVFQGVLPRKLGECDALDRRPEARGVDEGEHVRHAFVFLAD
mmetsp:Transcript_22370/g.45220  ORF Transcript_22370/g.45220 Transcript_22370/m.45220 type:complete len:217 (-) Transcript_22370:988-1638(-)